MLNIITHKIYLNKILTSFYQDSTIAGVLGFKGGTAANFFYGLPRFSVDLDFDLRYKTKEIPMEYKKELTERVTEILQKDLEIRDKSLKEKTLFWLVSYQKGEQQIKIEISTRIYPNTYENKNYYGVNIPVLKLSDQIAHKLVAITERRESANRDLFDAYYFLNLKEIDAINYEIIKLRTGKKPKEFYLSLYNYLSKVNNNKILAGLGELIDNKQKEWVKRKLLSELKNKVLFMSDLV